MKKNNFDNSYLRWKAWGDNSSLKPFGHLSLYESDYYRKLIRLAGATRDSRILEVGFGNGGFLSYCRKNGYNVVGTEMNLDLLSIAKHSGYDVYDGEYLDKAEVSSYDFIFAFDVLEHIHPERTINFLTSCRRVLQSGGLAIFRFPNGDSPMAMPNFNADVTHVNWIGSGKISYYSQVADFQDFKIIATPQLIFTSSLPHAIYHCVVLPIKAIINQFSRFLFYPGRRLNFVAVDLIALLKK